MSEPDQSVVINVNIPLQTTIDKTNESSSKQISQEENCIQIIDAMPAIYPDNYVPYSKHITIKWMHELSDNLTEVSTHWYH